MLSSYIKKVKNEIDVKPVEFTVDEMRFIKDCLICGYHPRRAANEIIHTRTKNQQSNSIATPSGDTEFEWGGKESYGG